MKKARLKGMKNSNTNVYYVTDDKLHQVGRHCDLFKTIAVLNTVHRSNMNVKEILGNYERFLLSKRLF